MQNSIFMRQIDKESQSFKLNEDIFIASVYMALIIKSGHIPFIINNWLIIGGVENVRSSKICQLPWELMMLALYCNFYEPPYELNRESIAFCHFVIKCSLVGSSGETKFLCDKWYRTSSQMVIMTWPLIQKSWDTCEEVCNYLLVFQESWSGGPFAEVWPKRSWYRRKSRPNKQVLYQTLNYYNYVVSVG